MKLPVCVYILLWGSLALGAASSSAAQGAKQPLVERIEFAGRQNVREDTCVGALSLKPGEAFTPARLEADRKALLALGFFRSVGAGQNTMDGATRVTFRLVEWPPVRHIRVLGNTVVEGTAIREVISTQLGQVLCGPQLQDDIRSIERLYRERGYVARISEKLLGVATETGILRFEILEVRVGEVQIEGGTPKLQARAREALRETAPNLYRPEDVTLDQRRLLRVRGIRRAIPQVTITSPGAVRILWRLNPPADADPPPVP